MTKNNLFSISRVFIWSSLVLFLNGAQLFAQTCGYGFQKEVSIDHSNVSGSQNLNDFPLLISVTDNDLRTVANGGNVENPNGYDIIFVDEFGQPLAHQIEEFIPTTGEFIAWVRIPILYANLNTTIFMYYGNSAISSDPSTMEVWDNDYQAVWHLHDDVDDGTSIGNHMTNNGSTDATGKIGDGQSFNGSTQYLARADGSLNGNIPSMNSGSPDQFTLSGWIYVDVLNSRRPLLSKQMEDVGTDRGFVFMMEDDNRLKAELFKNNVSGDRTEVYSTATLSANTWYYISMTYNFITDGTSESNLYINGVNDGSTNTSVGPVVNNTRDLAIGRYFWNGGTNYYHDGLIDEVRISDVVRSDNWIATEYENQNDPSSFVSFGAEVGGAYTPVIPTCGYGYRKVITTNSGVISGGGSHTDFPMLVSFTDNDLRTVANGGQVQNDNGFDIVFTDTNLIPLDHQIESYVPSTGEYSAWIRIPTLPTGSDMDIYMFYGDPTIFADPSTSCTWSSDYLAVWHLHDDFLDASANAYHGTNNGSSDNTSSKIADGQSFDGNDFIELLTFPNLNTDFTITAWINTTDNTQAGQRVFCDDESNTGGYALSLGDGGAGRLRFYSRGMNSVILDGPNNSVSNNTWYYVSGVADISNTDRRIFLNGAQIAANTNDNGTWGADNGDASIGGETNSGETANRFEGLIDEVRIARVARSTAWLTTEYNNQNNPSAFYSVGAEISLNATTVQDGDWDQTTTWSGGVVPGLAANVTILHDVDIDDRDERICNLTISNSNNTNTFFDVENGQTLEVIEDVRMESSGTGDVDVTLRTNDNNSKLVVRGDLIIVHTNGDDVFLDVENAGDSIVVYGDFLIDHTGGDNIDILVDNATGVLMIYGNVIASMNDGVDDIIEFDLNAGEMIVEGIFIGSRNNDFGDFEFDLDGGNFTADSVWLGSSGGGGDDQILITIDGTSQFTVNGDMHISQGGGDDHRIYLNNNNGTSAQFIVNGDLIWDKMGGDDLEIFVDDVNSLFHVTGDFTINSTGGEEVVLDLDDGNFDIDGNFTLLELNNSGEIVNVDMDGGTMNIGGTFFGIHLGDANFLIDLDGNSVINAGSLEAYLYGSTGNEEMLIDIDGSSSINITGHAEFEANTGNDMEIHLGQNSAGSTAELNVGGNLTLDHQGASGVDDLQFILNDNSHVTVDGLFIMLTNGSGSAGNFYTQMNDNSILTVRSDIGLGNTIGSGYLEILMNDNSHIQIGGDFLRFPSPNNFGNISSSSANTTIEYNGTAAQIFADDDAAGTDGIEYEVVIINNTFGTEPQLTMGGDVTLDNSITFTNGVLQSTSANMLTIADNASANIGNVGSYVSGPLTKEGDDDFIFPVGKSGKWAPIAISNMINGPTATDVFVAEYFNTTHPESFWDSLSYAGDDGGMYNTSILEYWDLARTNGVAQPQVTLYWSDNTVSEITDTADLVVAHYLGGSAWANEGGAAFGTLGSGNVRSLNHITSFSVFTFGSTNSTVNPLPVELLNFIAVAAGDVVQLNWSTLSEVNNQDFTVERSRDAKNFTKVISLPGAGNAREMRHYNTIDDQPFPGLSYYRLKQTDYNGAFSYSEIQVVDFENHDEFKIFPNPTSGGVIYFSQRISGTIFDGRGDLIKAFQNSGNIDISHYAQGIYYLRIEDGRSFKFAIE